VTTEKLNEKTRNFDNTVRSCDPEAVSRLSEEIDRLKEQGFDVSIGWTEDEAYQSPEMIHGIYKYLHKRDRVLAGYRRQITRQSLAGQAINWARSIMPSARSRRAYEIDQQLEPLRDELLFGASETNSQPWHQQRGRALALLTIAAAHDLKVDGEGGGIYETMSGLLDESVLDYQFGENSNLGGMNLAEALVWSEQEFSGRNYRQAKERAARRVRQTREFTRAKTTRKFKDVVQYCTDSLGIRSRKEEMNREVHDYVESRLRDGEDISQMTVMSFGCGTALPLLEVMSRVKNETNGQCPTIILLDQDPLALASAAKLAEKMGLSDNIQLECHRLFSKLGSPLDLGKILKDRQLDISEDSGLREYLPDGVYRKLTKETWQHLKDDGLMITGNMNKNRPQAEFLHGMMGWKPRVIMRRVDKGFRLHKEAGIASEKTRARITRDGVYTLFFSVK